MALTQWLAARRCPVWPAMTAGAADRHEHARCQGATAPLLAGNGPRQRKARAGTQAARGQAF
jgi:hypothetical protein